MGLIDLLAESPDELQDKQVHQLIAFAGLGKLVDGSDCSTEFRCFLGQVPSTKLQDYADQCLTLSFTDSGLALQDVVNEVATRIGAQVEPGRYRGTSQHVGHDGLWTFPSGHSIIVEVKTTDAYRIDLNKIAKYRKALTAEGRVQEDTSSMLLVVGRQDTGDLEAQIRGSKHAWDIRIISVDALLRLMSTKEEVEDPDIIQRIHSILIPREFTRLDEIADVLFSTTEDLKQDVLTSGDGDEVEQAKSGTPRPVPVAFHDACVERVTKRLGQPLIKRTRARFSSPDGNTVITCSVSREHNPDTNPNYWFAFHPHQREFLRSAGNAYVVFGCGDSSRVLLIPFQDFEQWLDGMWVTRKDDRFYWHVVIYRHDGKFLLHRRKGIENPDLTAYLLPEADH